MMTHYESPENLMVISQKCMTIIEGLVLTHTYKGGVSAYTTKLENTYMDLEYCTGREKPDFEKKTKLLLSIKDTRFFNLRDTFSMSTTYTFSSCLTMMNQHATMFGNNTKARVNSSKGKGGGKGRGKEKGKGKARNSINKNQRVTD